MMLVTHTLTLDISNPESYEDLVELLVPVLQKRGLMWDDYAVPGGTYRENLLNTPGQPTVPEGHPARNFRYEALKEKYADENGDIVIDARTEKKPVEAVPVPEIKSQDLPLQKKPITATVEVAA